MKIIAIDPGSVQSAFVFYDAVLQRIEAKNIVANPILLKMLEMEAIPLGATLVIEQVASMGMPVGEDVFETVFWSGRFVQAFAREFHRVKRHEVKMHLCGNMRAKDGNIRQSLIDKLGAPGTKKQPGATYGISGDCWAALAVAVTFAEKVGMEKAKTLLAQAA